MFFIFGSPRSGTTLLAQCLSAHPDLVVPAETDFIVPTAFVFNQIADVAVRRAVLRPLITNSILTRASLGEYLGEGQLLALIEANCSSLPMLLDAIYSAVARAASAKLAGDKTPNDLLYGRILVQSGAIPHDAKVIHIVRDVRDVTSSLMRREWVAGIETFFPRLWSQTNLYLFEQFQAAPNYLLVRYEDFVRDPGTELLQICRLLAVSTDHLTTMIDPGKRHRRYIGSPHHGMLYRPISEARIGVYRHDLPGELVATCHRQASEGMLAFSYLDGS